MTFAAPLEPFPVGWERQRGYLTEALAVKYSYDRWIRA